MLLQIRSILVYLLILYSVPQQAQTLKAYEKAADEAYEKKDFYNAVYYYEIVLKSKQKTGVYYKYANACRQAFA